MARFWSDKDANGKPLTDGRLCYVVESDLPSTDPNWQPPIFTYGKDRDEVFEKLANTMQTAQEQIHRMRKTPPPPVPARPAAAAASVTDVAKAVTDLSNPAAAAAAARTLVQASGVDLDKIARGQMADRIATIAQAWLEVNPDFPVDPRNQRMLIDRAVILAGGKPENLSAQSLSAAFSQLTEQEVFHEPKTVQPEGTPDSRTVVRNATSYKRNSLRSPEPPAAPARETAKEAKWRDIRDHGTAKAQEDAIRNDPGYVEWVDRQYQKTA